MGVYSAKLVWERGNAAFVDNRFSRRHILRFDGGAKVVGSSSPTLLAPPLSDPAAVDPEEAFVGALSSCHMLFFLFIAAQGKILIDRYEDAAEGWLEIAANGRLAMTRVTLRPTVWFGGAQKPDQAEIIRLHDKAHARCFLANSVLSNLVVEPVFVNESRC